MTYADVISRFFYESLPIVPVSDDVRFEAVAAEVFGTKQRRFGPMPSPEAQVAVRNVLRASPGRLTLVMPWGASKQSDGAKLDVLEFMAIKQLACLRCSLAKFGVETDFVFRMEDLGDRWLFGDARVPVVAEYVQTFSQVAAMLLYGASVRTESMYTRWDDFRALAESVVPAFYAVLTGRSPVASLADIGWAGTLPQAQRDYYYAAYAKLYPGQDHDRIMARYFAAALARVKLRATCAPDVPHVTVCFSHPIPGAPVNRPQVFYRTLPERCTHQHKAPWMASGHLEVGDDGTCCPKYTGETTATDRLTEHNVKLFEATVTAPYVVV